MSPAQIQALLDELCGVRGFCLPPAVQVRLRSEPPVDMDAFADAVIRAEGLDPVADVSNRLHRDIHNCAAKHFRAAQDAETNRSVDDDVS